MGPHGKTETETVSTAKPARKFSRRRRQLYMRRAHFLKMWRISGNLYGVSESEADLPPARLDRAPLATGQVFGRLKNACYTEHSPFELEHLLSLGVLGLRRDPDGVIRSRFARPRLCRHCYGMSWRVRLDQCDGCGLAHRQECA